MIGFGIVFVAAVVAFALVIQGLPAAAAVREVPGRSTRSWVASWAWSRGCSCSLFVIDHPRPVLPHVPGPASTTSSASCASFWERSTRRRPASYPRHAIPAFVSLFSFLIPTDIENIYAAYPPPSVSDPGPRAQRPFPRESSPATRSTRPGAARRPAGPRPAPGDRADGASGGSWRSRRTSARTTARRTPGSGGPPATRSCSGRRASPTCTLSTGCTTA